MQNPDTLLEAAVLSDLIFSPENRDRIFTELTDKDFFNLDNRAIFQTLRAMYEEKEAIDLLMVHKRLEKAVIGSPGIVKHLHAVTDQITTPAHTCSYIKIIRRNTCLREIRGEIRQLNPEATTDQIEKIMDLIQSRDSGGKQTTVTPADFIDDYIAGLKTKKCAGLDTGFSTIDHNIHTQASDLIVIGARTNVGKTAFLTNVLVNMLQRDIPCLYCPTEMRPAQFMDRIAPLVINVGADKFRSRKFDQADIEQISGMGKMVTVMPLTLLDIASPNIQEVRMAVKSSGCKVLFLDYLGRCSMPREATRMREIERFMVELKNICVDMGILCLLAVQLSRATDYNKDNEPRLADLSDSSAIEKEADAVVFLWRDPKTPGLFDTPNIAGVLAKNRHGLLKDFRVKFEKRYMKMTEEGYAPREDYHEPKEVSLL